MGWPAPACSMLTLTRRLRSSRRTHPEFAHGQRRELLAGTRPRDPKVNLGAMVLRGGGGILVAPN
jgi:hypothetical protein